MLSEADCNCTPEVCNGEGYKPGDPRRCRYCTVIDGEWPCPADPEAADSYTDHMRWCKERALAYLDRGDLENAYASFASDVMKHPDTNTAAVTGLLATVGLMHYVKEDVAGMRKFIEGFA